MTALIEAADARLVLAACRDASLPRRHWTHEAHVAVAWALHREVGDPAVALGELRGVITAYNARTGASAGRIICHETITRYHLAAVAALGNIALEAIVAHPWTSRHAPLRHWTRPHLLSVQARRTWVPPDRAPLPFGGPLVPLDPGPPAGSPRPTTRTPPHQGEQR